MPHSLEDNPAYLNFRSEGGRVLYGEDVYVGYRFFDKISRPPMFSFGHGLSYTTFEFSGVEVEVSEHSSEDRIVRVNVANTGTRAGAEVVQVYIAPVQPRIRRPAKELKGFKKVFLQPSEQASVEVLLDLKTATSFWCEYENKWCSEAGVYKLLIGNSSNGPFIEKEFKVDKTRFWLGL